MRFWRGCVCALWIGGTQPNSCVIKLNGDGSQGLLVGTVDLTGTRTTFRQIVADEFQLPPDQVTVNTLDTDAAPYPSTSAGSKTTYTMSFALKDVCDSLKAQLQDRASDSLDLPGDQLEYQAGQLYPKRDPSQAVTLKELGRSSVFRGGGPILATGAMSRALGAPSFAAHVVDVGWTRRRGR